MLSLFVQEFFDGVSIFFVHLLLKYCLHKRIHQNSKNLVPEPIMTQPPAFPLISNDGPFVNMKLTGTSVDI
jgi:hypothetical protein